MNIKHILLLLFVLGFGSALVFVATQQNKPSAPPTLTASPPSSPDSQHKLYENPQLGVRFSYPSNWLGPEIVETANGFRFEIGTDTVYPYGIGLDERIYTKPNSYYLVVQYNKKPEDKTKEAYQTDSPWLTDYLALNSLPVGDAKTRARSKITKLKDIKMGKMSGFELISTLSETAQTEMFFMHEVFLVDENLNTLRISGSPANVDVPDKTKWRQAYETVDTTHQQIFQNLVNSIQLY